MAEKDTILGAMEESGAAGKWTGGVRELLLDCQVDAAWELVSDWANWQRWWPGNPKFELLEGENRKAGCLRRVAAFEVAEAWCTERLLAIDKDNHFLSYNVEEDHFFPSVLEGYVASVQFRGTSEGKTMMEYWNYEVKPVQNQTPETFSSMMTGVFKAFVKDIERGAQRLAAGLDPKPQEPTANALQAVPLC